MFAHSLAELRLPDEGHNAKFQWTDIWPSQEGVHTWYGQAYSDDTHSILSWHIHSEIAREPLKVPDCAFAYAIIHMDLKPVRAPNKPCWGFPQCIEALKAQRGGQLPPGVPLQLPDYMMHKLSCALQEFKKPVESNLLLKLLLADPTTALNAEEPPEEEVAGVSLGPAKEPPEEFVQVPVTAAPDDSEEEVLLAVTPATPPGEVPHAAGQLATSSSAVLTITPKKTRRSQPKEVPQHRVTEPQGPIADTSGINKMPRLLQVALNQVRKQQ